MSRPLRSIRPRDVDCSHCGAIPGTSCTAADRWGRDRPGRPAPSFGYHAARVELADQLEDERRGREYPACACGSSRPHLTGPDCRPALHLGRFLLTEHPHSGPPPAEEGAPTAH